MRKAPRTRKPSGKDVPKEQYDAVREKWAGAIGLLCECSVKLGNGTDANSLRDMITAAAQDWCKKSRWTVRRTIHRIEVVPPHA